MNTINKNLTSSLFWMGFVLIVIICISVSLGTVSIPLFQVISDCFKAEDLRHGDFIMNTYIIMQVRMPRVILCLLTGISLGIGGCIMQTLFHNPLASPFTMGVSSAASFGAALAMVLGVNVFGENLLFEGYSYVTINAFIFGLLSLGIVSTVAKISKSEMSVLILVGTAVNSLFSAGVSILKYISDAEALKNLEMWLMGGFWGANWQSISILFPILLISIVCLIKMSWDFNALNAGEETASSLGVSVKWLKKTAIFFVTLITSVTIAFAGIIGFVGLVAPHIARSIVGTDNRYLIPSSAFIGAILLLASDTIARVLISPREIPVGIITAVIGVPFFLYILSNRKNKTWG